MIPVLSKTLTTQSPKSELTHFEFDNVTNDWQNDDRRPSAGLREIFKTSENRLFAAGERLYTEISRCSGPDFRSALMNRAEASLLLAAASTVFLFALWNASQPSAVSLTHRPPEKTTETPQQATETHSPVAESVSPPLAERPFLSREEIESRLDRRLGPVYYERLSLDEVMHDLANQLDVDILWDDSARSCLRRGHASEISLQTIRSNITARTLIQYLLEQLQVDRQVDFVIRDEVLWFTTLERTWTVEVYDCRRLVDAMEQRLPDLPAILERSGNTTTNGDRDIAFVSFDNQANICQLRPYGLFHDPSASLAAIDTLLMLIRQVIEPDSWTELNYPSPSIHAVGNSLVIAHTARTHRKIRVLLATLYESMASDAGSGDSDPTVDGSLDSIDGNSATVPQKQN